MKKFTTKLLMSIIAVAFAFVALGTSTYAWFSMNTTVTATGMEVGAKSNSTYLLINTGDNDTVSEIRTGNLTTVSVAVANENTLVLPSKPKEASEIAADGVEINATSIGQGKYFAYGATAVTDATTAAVAANWYTATSHKPGQALNFQDGNDFHSLSDNDATYLFSKYVIKKTVYLTLAEGSNDAYHLTVTPTITLKETDPAQTATDITAVRVLVAVGTQTATLSTTSGEQDLYTADTDNVLSATNGTVLTADIYIYYDGSQSVVTTNNSADLAAATISLAFNVELKPEA